MMKLLRGIKKLLEVMDIYIDDCGGSLMGAYICENLLKCTLYMYSYCMPFIPQ